MGGRPVGCPSAGAARHLIALLRVVFGTEERGLPAEAPQGHLSIEAVANTMEKFIASAAVPAIAGIRAKPLTGSQ